MRKCTILLAVAFVAMLVAGNAYATLIVDIRAVSATGGAQVMDAKDVNVAAAAVGDTVTFDVFAYFTAGTGGSGGNCNIQQIQGGMGSTRDAAAYDVKGNISPIVQTAGVWDMGGQAGVPAQNSVGDMVIPLTSTSSVWSAESVAAR